MQHAPSGIAVPGDSRETAYYRHDGSPTLEFITRQLYESRAILFSAAARYRLLVSRCTRILLTEAFAQASLESESRVALFSDCFDLAKRNLHVCARDTTHTAGQMKNN